MRQYCFRLALYSFFTGLKGHAWDNQGEFTQEFQLSEAMTRGVQTRTTVNTLIPTPKFLIRFVCSYVRFYICWLDIYKSSPLTVVLSATFLTSFTNDSASSLESPKSVMADTLPNADRRSPVVYKNNKHHSTYLISLPGLVIILQLL